MLPDQHEDVVDVDLNLLDELDLEHEVVDHGRDPRRGLLAEAGHPNGFETEMQYPTTPEFIGVAAQVYAQQAKQIGVNLTFVGSQLVMKRDYGPTGKENATFITIDTTTGAFATLFTIAEILTFSFML